MTTGDAAVTLASAGVLAQLGDPASGGIEGLLALGFKGLMLVAVIALWRSVEKKDKAERDERERRDKIEEEERARRDRLEQEREQAFIDLVKSVKGRQ